MLGKENNKTGQEASARILPSLLSQGWGKAAGAWGRCAPLGRKAGLEPRCQAGQVCKPRAAPRGEGRRGWSSSRLFLLLWEACLASGSVLGELCSRTRTPGAGATYIQAGHVHPVAHDHIDELVWGAVFSEEHLRVEDL